MEIRFTGEKPIQHPLEELKSRHAEALWCWARIEAEVFGIYASALGLQNLRQWEAIRDGFFAINSFEMRLTMTHAVAKTVWPEQHHHMKAWNEIYELSRKAARQRGKIAHLTGGIWIDGVRVKGDGSMHGDREITTLAQPFGHPKFPRSHADAKSIGFDAAALKRFCDEWIVLLEKMDTLSHLLVNEPQKSASRELSGGPASHPRRRGARTPKAPS